MQLSLLLSLLVFGALVRWAQDDTLMLAAESWRDAVRAEVCAITEGRIEAGRRNIEAAAAVLKRSPASALDEWAARHPTMSCPPGGELRWDVRQERHENDRGVNWVMVWREGV